MDNILTFRFALPRFFSWGSEDYKRVIELPSVEIRNIETGSDRRTRRLKHLIKANHANFSVLYHDLRFHNHMDHILGSAYLFDSTPNHLNDIYDVEAKQLDPWVDSPSEISKDDWREYLGKKEYQRAFVDFFEDQLVQLGYDSKALLEEYAFKGTEPLINGMILGGLAHPLIHLGYAHELTSPTLIIEALTMGASCYNPLHKYIDDPLYSIPTISPLTESSTSPFTLLQKLHSDPRFDDLFTDPGSANLALLFEKREKEILEYFNAWTMSDPKRQFEESQHAAVALLVASTDKSYDFFLVHTLTSSHAVRILLPSLPVKFQIPLVRQWWLFTLAVYVAQLRPAIDLQRITKVALGGRGWGFVEKCALQGRGRFDAHFVKGCRSMREAARTWRDEDQFYLKAAVRFAEGWNGWGGFGVAGEEH